MVGILIKKNETEMNRYIIYRTLDGSFVTELPTHLISPMVSLAHGGHQVIMGIIDIRSRKYMPWGVEALMHIASHCKMHLFLEDFSDKEMEERRD